MKKNEHPPINTKIGKAALFYFSGTGNTWWVGQQIQRELEQIDIPTKIFSIESPSIAKEKGLNAEILESELLIFGYPIHGSDMPRIMKDFFLRLPNLLEYKTFPHYVMIFCTQYMFSGDGAYFFKENLESKGYSVYWTAHFRMPNNICVPKSPFQFTNDKAKIQVYLEKALQKTNTQVSLIQEGLPDYDGKGLFARFGGWLQRYFYVKEIDAYSQKWSVNSNRCILCQKCVRICPTNNISYRENRIHFDNNCILCLRCYNYCPSIAIQYGKIPGSLEKVPYRGPISDFQPELLKK